MSEADRLKVTVDRTRFYRLARRAEALGRAIDLLATAPWSPELIEAQRRAAAAALRAIADELDRAEPVRG